MCYVNLILPTHRHRVLVQMIPFRPDVLGMASVHIPVVSEHHTLVMLQRNEGDSNEALRSTRPLSVYCMVSCFLLVPFITFYLPCNSMGYHQHGCGKQAPRW